MSVEYAIIVKNKTRLESLIERFNTKAQARFYIERSGGNFEDYVLEHDTFHQSLVSLQSQLTGVIKHKIVARNFLPSYIFSDNNLIVVIGQDGLVANTAKYAKGIPIIGVNPDEDRYDGVLLPFTTKDFLAGVKRVISDDFEADTRRFAEARLNDGQRLLAFNDLYVGADSHISSRYRITYKGQTEEQSSSGIIISTLAGSTGWLSSIFNMAFGVASLFEKNIAGQRPHLHDDQLLFAVREPFESVRTQAGIVMGEISQKASLKLESLMPGSGVIFSDGIAADFLHFNSGAIATIGLASETAVLVK